MSRPQMLVSFVLACASSVVVARAQSQTVPSPEVKKLAVIVGNFTVEDELKAGFIGPNSPPMKFSGTDDCRWTANGFAVICETALHRPGTKYSETSFYYYDPTSKTYRYHAVDSSGGIESKTGTVSGDVWTWLGDSVFGGKVYHTRYTMKVVSADSYEYTDESGESENSMKVFVSGKETRIASSKSAKSQRAQ
ncbi:MAG TPA: DUF1579 family protein [Terriglobales bacterium]|nr:DUF1579 family protein [Terriglobales bacterium]